MLISKSSRYSQYGADVSVCSLLISTIYNGFNRGELKTATFTNTFSYTNVPRKAFSTQVYILSVFIILIFVFKTNLIWNTYEEEI